MKKIISCLVLFLGLVAWTGSVQADMFTDVINQQKPVAVLIYADWAEDLQSAMTSFGALEQDYSNKYNLVRINISTAEAKEFNKTYYIYPNLPYLLLFKDRGRLSRMVVRDCLKQDSCVRPKLDIFAN